MAKTKLWGGACLVLAATLLAGCPPAPKLSVSTTTHHFGIDTNTQEYETTFAFQVWNSGSANTELVFAATASEPWIALDVPKTTSTGADDKVTITVTIDREYSEAAKSADLGFASGEIDITASVGTATVAITTAPDYFTENISNGGDLEGLALLFTPNNGPSFYDATKSEITEFPTDPTGAFALDFGIFGDPVRAGLFGDEKVSFYGVEYDELFISSDGWVSFGEAGNTPLTLGDHFAAPQISLLPVDATAAGAKVSYLQESDKLVITYENAPTAGAPGFGNNFQLELFFDGTIQTSYLDVDPAIAGVVGLSVGIGAGGVPPTDFLETDLSDVNTGTVKTL
jgi:hypothetical protein